MGTAGVHPKRLTRDGVFAARMAYCGPRGIPLSRFLDWPQADQDAALLWQAHEARRCSSCGTHPDVWDPDAGGDRNALVAEPHFCRGCERLEQLRGSDVIDPNAKGVHLRLVRPLPPATDKDAAGGD